MPSNSCPVCSSRSDLKCGKCVQVYYCSREHQKAHWPLHKKDCFPFKVETVAGKGRVLISTKAFSPGQVIFKERPLVMMPYVRNGDEIGSTCVSCCKIMEESEAGACFECGWPVCGEGCEVDARHAGMECQTLKDRNISPNQKASCLILQVLRCFLMKGQQPERYTKTLQLEDNLKELSQSMQTLLTFRYMAQVFRKVGLAEDSESEAEIVKIIGILHTNVLSQGTDVRQKQNKRGAVHLFEKACLASHSCFPNSTTKVEKSGSLTFFATRDIVTGDELTITYCPLIMGTSDRMKMLLNYCFQCNCPRCLSPTEFGSHFSSVKCTECPGYVCPSVQEKGKICWRCEGCSRIKSLDEIENILTPLEEKVQSVIGTTDYTAKGLQRYDAIIAKCEEVLHPNHSLLFDLHYDLMDYLHNLVNMPWTPREMETRHMDRIVQIGEQRLLPVLDLIVPGPRLTRGRIYYFITYGLSERCAKEAFSQKKAGNSDGKISQSGQIGKFFTFSKKAIEVLSLEPKGTDDETFVKKLSDQVEKVSGYLKLK